MMKTSAISILLGMLQLFIALSAIPPGIMLVVQPNGSSLGFTLELLEGSPFQSYLLPGLFLFGVIGLGNLFAAIFTFQMKLLAPTLGVGLGIILLGWIFVQVYITGWISFLQPLYLGVGAIELLVAFWSRKALKA